MRDEPATFALDIDDTVPTSPERMLWCAVILRGILDIDIYWNEINAVRIKGQKQKQKKNGTGKKRGNYKNFGAAYFGTITWFLDENSTEFRKACDNAFGESASFYITKIRNLVREKLKEKNLSRKIP